MMNIVMLSDANYEYQIKNFIRSLEYAKIKEYRLFYYSIGFDSTIENPKVIKIHWPKDERRFDFYKPEVCLNTLNYTKENLYFFDADILLSKRFSKFPVRFGSEYPLFCTGGVQNPFTFIIDKLGKKTEFDEKNLMSYLGVRTRSMDYVLACFFTFDENCRDFLEEYKSFCKNEYLLSTGMHYYAFTDETPVNVILWKKEINDNYGRGFVNTHKFSTFKLCEENDNIKKTLIDNNFYEQCEDSSKVYFYHGTKDKEENEKILKYIDENS